jgi:hypothetical protein
MTRDIFAGHRPLVAILRGIRPAEAEAAFDALTAAGSVSSRCRSIRRSR